MKTLGTILATSLTASFIACGSPASRTESMAVQTGEVAPVRAPAIRRLRPK